MFGREWLLETDFGEEVRLRTGRAGDTPPDEDALWDIEGLLEGLLWDLNDPSRRRELERLFVALTGRRPESDGEYSPFELSGELYRKDLQRTLHSAAAAGQLRVERVERPRVNVRQEIEVALPPLGPAPMPAAETTTFFEVQFVDEVGDPIDGLEVFVRAGVREEKLTTDGQGVARLDGATSSFGSVRIGSRKALGDIVEPRFARGRVPKLPELPFTKLVFSGELPTVSLESEERKLVVVHPRLGKLFVELWDKSGRQRHTETEYAITGPVSFEGVTDNVGRLLHEEVPPGDYELTLKVDVNRALKPPAEASDADANAGQSAGGGGGGSAAGAGHGGAAEPPYEPQIEESTSPLVVLDSIAGEPQERLVGVLPHVVLARMRGMLFDTNKTFILPTAIPSLEKIRNLYEELNPAELLIVGHTDTTSEPAVNDPLSKKRAEAMQQYLEDDVDGWLSNYETSVPQKQRWGAREDRLMLIKLPGYDAKPTAQPPIEWYQKHHNDAVDAGVKDAPKLEVDGKSGPKTRRELITDYMNLDGTTLSEDSEFHVSIQTHGCGENFPLDESLEEVDDRSESERNDERDRHDRRVELFFFDTEFGVRHAPTSPEGEEYLLWRKEAQAHEHDFSVEGVNNRATVLPISYAHFRTGSAVLLPEGETPVSGAQAGSGANTSSVCALAMALRFNEERPGHSLLVAGHTDSVGGDKDNQKLSEQRAEMVHAVLMGEREVFADIAKDPKNHKVSDWKQILRWASVALAHLEPTSPPPAPAPGTPAASFRFADCNPPAIDDNAWTGLEPLKTFQRAYNAHKAALGATAADLEVDGDIGKNTWGAIFDCYQFNMAEELGEVEDEADEADPTKLLEGLGRLRGLVTFLPADKEFLGFGEAHPADGQRKDGVASQENRRVEVLFFAQGQEPDLAILKEAPEITELYSRDSFKFSPVRMRTARRHRYAVRLLDLALEPMPFAQCRVSFLDQSIEVTCDGEGVAKFAAEDFVPSCEIEWQPTEDAPAGSKPMRRMVQFVGDEQLDARLDNLGYIQEDEQEDERLSTFEQEFGLASGSPDSPAMLMEWHDRGIKPEPRSNA